MSRLEAADLVASRAAEQRVVTLGPRDGTPEQLQLMCSLASQLLVYLVSAYPI